MSTAAALPLRRCYLVAARVRADRLARLSELSERLFLRRAFLYLSAADQQWQRPELVQLLRRLSTLYCQCSTPFDGPMLFALGYFRVYDGVLEPVADRIPIDNPELLAWVLSEFLEPGAQVWVEMDAGWCGWHIEGEGQVHPLATNGNA